jgi:hypothetical protein
MVQDKRSVLLCEVRQLTGQISQLEYKCSVEKNAAKLEKIKAQKRGLEVTRDNLKNLVKIFYQLSLNAPVVAPTTTAPAPASPKSSPKSVHRDLADFPAPPTVVSAAHK